jgi:hypothetical protein
MEQEPSLKLTPELLAKEPILQFFNFSHLQDPGLRAVSMPFGALAIMVVESLPRNPERTVALRKLLEAKDAAVRAVIFKAPEGTKP